MKYSIKVDNCQLWKKSRFLRVEEMKQSGRGMCSRGNTPRKHEHDVIFGCPMAKLWPTGHFDP